jgi:thiol oxidase
MRRRALRGELAAALALCALAAARGAAAAAAPSPPVAGLLELDEASFAGALAETPAEWVLLEFYAHWCPACRAFQPAFEEAAAALAARGAAAPRAAAARVDCAEERNAKLCADFGVSGYPTLFAGRPAELAARAAEKAKKLELGARTRAGVLAALSAHVNAELGAGGAAAEAVASAGAAPGAMPAHLQILKPGSGADMGDVEGATVEGWRFLASPTLLAGAPARAALEGWLELLSAAHPLARCRAGAGALAGQLPALWPPGARAPPDAGALAALPLCAPTAFSAYAGCAGEARGFTCGLWQLFHATAAHLPDAPGAGAGWLRALRGYVAHFFQCEECAKHFVAATLAREALAVSSRRDAVLWLWRTHNGVTARVGAEEAARGAAGGGAPRAPWPGTDECTDCRRAGGAPGGAPLWSEAAVYSFLLRHYAGGDYAAAAAGAGGAAAGRGARGGWGAAACVCSAAAACVYVALRGSGHYRWRRASGTVRLL